MIDTPIGWLLLFGFGIFTGSLAGLLGIGGGLLNVPILTLAGTSTLQAAATSLIGVLLSAVSGSVRNLQTGSLNWRVSATMGGFGLVAAQLGARLGDRIPDNVLSLGFAGLALVTIYLMGLKRSLKQAQEKQAKEQETLAPPPLSPSPPPYRFLPPTGIGLAAGVLSGLFGVGGGAVMVPLQMLVLNEPIKMAVRTSLGAIVAIGSSALVGQAMAGNVLWIPGLCLGAGAIVGAQFGTRLLPKLSDRTITVMFRMLLLGLAAYMMVRGLR
ncbi:MAG: sulfite exporter TauE/SafE family protein [Leptolyngbyaceae bacterium]|nr:sulfite exporter TauE/SafE family protein [Leptolyngbyaceae bacterium]